MTRLAWYRRIHRSTLLLACLLLAACAAAPPAPPANPPRQLALAPVVKTDRPVIAIVLGSGAARGFAHVGVLNVLEAHGIRPDIIVGTSAGSVVGALYAGGIRGPALLEAAQQLDIGRLTDWVFPDRGVVRGEELQRYVDRLLQRRPIEALPTRFVAVVTDLHSGELVAFNHGDTGMAVRASCTVPGIVQPFTIGGREYVDGGIVSQVPVRVARELGADIVIAVDVSRSLMAPQQLDSTLAVMHQALIIMSHTIAAVEIAEADIVIHPAVGDTSLSEFERRDQLVTAGEAAAREALPAIERLLQP